MKRRKFITTLGALIATGAAGCSSSREGSGGASGSTDTPTPKVEKEEPTATPTKKHTATDTPSPEPTDTPSPTDSPTREPAILILEHDWEVVEEYESDAVQDDWAVVGIGKNNADVPLDVFIEFRFYDEEGIQLDSFTFNANGVQPGTKFRFEAPYLGDDADEVAEYGWTWEAYEA